MKAYVLTPWTGAGTEQDPYRPLVTEAYFLNAWHDVTGQPSKNLHPDPNLTVVEIDCESANLAAIDADPQYKVLFTDSRKNTTTMPGTEFSALKEYLLAQGFSLAALSSIVGEAVSGRSRGEISETLLNHLRTLPKQREEEK